MSGETSNGGILRYSTLGEALDGISTNPDLDVVLPESREEQGMTDTNLNEALKTVKAALEVNLSLWRDDVEPGDFDRDVIAPTQAALAALSQIEARLGELEKEQRALRDWYDESPMKEWPDD